MKKLIWIVAALTITSQAQARTLYTGQDFSGVYDCTGEDAKEGNYKGIVTMILIPEQSSGKFAAYKFKLDLQGLGLYLGEAVAEGDKAAIHFALNLPNSKDSGTGIATFKKNSQGKRTFHKFYYEPEYKGGNHGFEDCVER